MDRAAEVRAAIAARGLRLYLVAARAGIHPSYLSGMLRGRIPLPDGVAGRVLQVVSDWPDAGAVENDRA